jgi:hypothetical protein
MRHKTYKRDPSFYGGGSYQDLVIRTRGIAQGDNSWRYISSLSLDSRVLITDYSLSGELRANYPPDQVFTISEESHLFNYDILVSLTNYPPGGNTRPSNWIIIDAITEIDLSKVKL